MKVVTDRTVMTGVLYTSLSRVYVDSMEPVTCVIDQESVGESRDD